MARKAQGATWVFGGKIPDAVIDTSFNMDIGETVVVGTSRLQGDKALIVLLTAVGRSQARQTTSPGPATARWRTAPERPPYT
jgi:hypothetical protein